MRSLRVAHLAIALVSLALSACPGPHGTDSGPLDVTVPDVQPPDAVVDVAAPDAPDDTRDAATTDACASESCVADPCSPNPCTQPLRTRCTVTGGMANCACDPGSHETATGCAPDVHCDPSTCLGHGRCDDSTGTPACTCDDPYAGRFCDACVAGAYADGHGGCTRTPCSPSPCTDPARSRCVVGATGATCECNAGTHDVAGTCTPDATCTSTSCSGHGTCTADVSGVHCACATGYAGTRCDGCTPELHPDGAGNCTADACLPNPCTAPHRGVCAVASGLPSCACDAGYHLEVDTCVLDEVCSAGSCSGHGTCSIVAGRARCACSTGFAAPACAACATGFHDDGAGGCTSDPCLPNPCAVPNRTACSNVAGVATCACVAGYHDDGAGGCTNDPCVPDPCVALNQACRNNAGAAQCYTPACNDSNPCTDDALVAGRCVFTTRADGSVCSTSACLTGERCTAGACGGGASLDCADTNPCTRDTCSATSGCAHASDDSVVPDDGLSCTTDRCAAGVASHAPSDAVCDDSRWCTGVERCTPGVPGADARGCTTTSVPAPPAPSTTCASYTCSDATMSYTLVTHTGTPCNDTIACTTGDTCTATGSCVGTLSASCPVTGVSCTGTTPLGTAFDIPSAHVRGAITLGGAALPASLPPAQVPASGYTYLYLQARDTGVEHSLATVTYNYGSTNYTLQAASDRVDANLPPGIYDLLYSHNVNGTTSLYTSRTPSDPLPAGYRLIRMGVVVGPGNNTLDVDLAAARVQGAITLDGSPLPATLAPSQVPASGYTYLYLVNADTGARHSIATVTYNYGSTNYTLQSTSDRVDANLPPGTYDLLLSHNVNGTTSLYTSRTPSDPIPAGYRVIRTGIVLAAGANTLDVNLTSGHVTGSVTLGGAPLPATLAPLQVPASGYTYLYLVNADTGARHSVATVTYNYGSTNYTLQSTSDRVDANVPPGTYDLLYSHNVNGTTSLYTSRTPTDPLPAGYRIIRTGIVVAPGTGALDIDLAAAHVTGAVTLGGAPLPATLSPSQVPASGYTYLYLVNSDTGARHSLATVTYNYGSTNYTLQATSDRVDANLPPGTYDLLYSHNVNGTTSLYTSRTPTDPLPAGYRIIRTGITLAAGANTVDVDLSAAHVTGVVTLAGSALPATLTPAQVPASGYTYLYLIDAVTGTRHAIATVTYNYGSTNYTLQAMSDRVDANLPPGTYDLLLSHNVNGTTTLYTSRTPSDPIPAAYRYIRRGIVLSPGANTLDVDITPNRVTGPITLDGSALPRTLPPAQVPASGYSYLYLVSQETGVEHAIGTLTYNYGSTNYTLQTLSDLADANLPPGTYDLLYSHNVNGTTSLYTSRTPTDPLPAGFRYLRTCVSVP